MVPNEHTAALSMSGIEVPVSVIRVPPISPLESGEIEETTGLLCRVSAKVPSPPSILKRVDVFSVVSVSHFINAEDTM
jgi:hypothetical protein